MRLCRDCEQWHTTKQWRGNCWKHPWERDKWSETASVPECRDFVDKYAKYQTVRQEVQK